MLHLLIKVSDNDGPDRDSVSPAVLTLAEACIRAARHSHSIIVEKWIEGSLPTCGYFHAQYLFSSAMILAMSSFLPIGKASDMAGFDTALEILRTMSENGHLAALEFAQNLDQIKVCLSRYLDERNNVGSNTPRNPAAAIGPGDTSGASNAACLTQLHPENQPGGLESPSAGTGPGGTLWDSRVVTNDAAGFTTAMAFLEPTMQDFLAQSDLDLGLTQAVDSFMDEADSLYTYLAPSMWTC